VSTSHKAIPSRTPMTAIQTRPLSSRYANESAGNRSAEMPMEKRINGPHFVAERAMEKFARWTSRTPSVAALPVSENRPYGSVAYHVA